MRTLSKKTITVVALICFAVVNAGCVPTADHAALQKKYDEQVGLTQNYRMDNEQLRTGNESLKLSLGEAKIDLRRSSDEIAVLEVKIDELRKSHASTVIDMKKIIGEGIDVDFLKDGGIALGEMLFTSGSHKLTKNGKALIKAVAAKLVANGGYVRVSGHTDSDKINRTKSRYADNYDLSAMRACAVVRELKTNGIKSSNLIGSFFGETLPRETNKTKAGKKLNRRTEIYLIEKEVAETLIPELLLGKK